MIRLLVIYPIINLVNKLLVFITPTSNITRDTSTTTY